MLKLKLEHYMEKEEDLDHITHCYIMSHLKTCNIKVTNSNSTNTNLPTSTMASDQASQQKHSSSPP